MNISGLVDHHARHRPDRPALVAGDRRLSFADLRARVHGAARALAALGVGKGDRVATLMSNRAELLELYWAAARLGAVAVPASPLLRGHGLAGLLRDASPRVVVADADCAAALAAASVELDLPRDRLLATGAATDLRSWDRLVVAAGDGELPGAAVSGADPCHIMYSSGTTGRPKGIVLSHRVRALYGALFASAWRMTPASVVLHAGSIVFNGAFLTLMPALYLGCPYVLHERFDPDRFVADVREHRVTHVVLVPSQIVALLAAPSFAPEPLASLEMVCSVGAPLLRAHRDALAEALPGRFTELYGLTEGFVTILDRDDAERKPGSVGVPPPLFELRVVDDDGRDVARGAVGEIAGRGPILMTGYHGRPDATAQAIVDGWLRTGDLGYTDDDGFLFLVDRKKDMIISGGVNVYPRDIEEVAARHGAVREAAVFGVPDATWGETPVAAVTLRAPGAPDAITARELQAWINSRVAARYQRVSAVVIVDELPRGVTGKTLKRALRDRYGGGTPLA